ncbi:MAG: DUF3494 domain-containing protein [Microbacteriaceae bacterium]|nr:DUF3494 domain-containing protein [Microbacteriaceae bacterium]
MFVTSSEFVPRSKKRRTASFGRVIVAILASCMVVASSQTIALPAFATPGTSPASGVPAFGAAAAYSVLGHETVTNTGNTVLRADLGVYPGTSITGFAPGIVRGTRHNTDANAQSAQSDATAAYLDLQGRAATATPPEQLGGLTLTPGVYTSASTMQITGTLTLDAQNDPNAIFIFQIGSALTTATASSVVLTNGAQASNVFWQIGSSATLGTYSSFTGSIVALTSITVTTGVSVVGRAIALNGAVTLDTDNFYPVVSATTTIAGGASFTTGNPFVPLSGVSNLRAGSAVVVTVSGQTLKTTVQNDGSWRVIPQRLADGNWPIIVTITDADGNLARATQNVVVNTTAPTAIMDGGASKVSTTSTPVISGTTTAPIGTPVTVTVAGQTLTTAVTKAGTWSVLSARLPDGLYPATVSITDVNGNVGRGTQSINVDTAAPTIVITGGLAKTVNDPSPTISGLTSAIPGTPVTVAVGGQTLSTTVQADGTFSVRSTPLADGTFPAVVSITDAAGNLSRATQTVTVNTVAPVITITTKPLLSSSTPVIAGTSNAGAGSPISVLIAGQTLTTTVGNDGTWQVTVQAIADGPYPVVASVINAGGVTGTTRQNLSINTALPLVAITGGPTALTKSATGPICGTTTAASGSPVTVTVGAQKLTSSVQPDSSWCVTPQKIADGTFPVVVTIGSGSAAGTAMQSLTVDTLAPVMTIAGGTAVITNNAAASILGSTTNAPSGSLVTVTVAGQMLSTTVNSAGIWLVTPQPVADGTYTIVAVVTDTAGNLATTSQRLTVDTVAAAITINAGTTTPRSSSVVPITGTSAAPSGSPVTVTVAGQTLLTLVLPDGSWSVTPKKFIDGAYQVTASVRDSAGNIGTATQTLSVNSSPPCISITGGSSRGMTYVSNTLARISGLTDAPAGSALSVTVNGQTVAGTVYSNYAWAIVPQMLPIGKYNIGVKVTTATGAVATTSQTLTVSAATVYKASAYSKISIDGASPMFTSDANPTISGKTDAPTGTAITVTINGAPFYTTALSNNTWSLSGSLGDDMTYIVMAYVTNAAKMTSSAKQWLTLASGTPGITITGLEKNFTSKAKPSISGFTSAQVGTVVTIMVDDMTYSTTVRMGGHWGIRTDTLGDGPHTATASVTNGYNRTGSVTQNFSVNQCGCVAVIY